jgi:hypothetical protein
MPIELGPKDTQIAFLARGTFTVAVIDDLDRSTRSELKPERIFATSDSRDQRRRD